MRNDKEYCIYASVRLDTGVIIFANNHAECIKSANCYVRQDMQGFFTSLGRHVDRVEGLKLQLEAEIKSKRGVYQSQLYSEDL